jgi:transcriptional regulator with XRE-family HTH domain
MNNRIVKLIKAEGLTNSKFASIMDIQRSNVTHIIDGRNKPSVNFFEKLIAKFPHVNIEWVITGIGEMYKQNEISVQESEQKKAVSPTLFPEIATQQTAYNQLKNDQTISQNAEQSIKETARITNVDESSQVSNIQTEELNVPQVQELKQILELKLEAEPEKKQEPIYKPELELLNLGLITETEKTEKMEEIEEKTEIKEEKTKKETIKETEAETKVETIKETTSSRNIGGNKNIENEQEIECVLIFHSDKTFKYYKPV